MSTTLPTYSGVATEKAVRQRQTDIKVDCFQNAHLHLDEISPCVGIITDVEEIVDTWRASFL